MAKEIRNPNDEGDGRRALCSDLGLRASFGFRHSDFVVNALELERCADDFGQTEAQLLRHERFETVAIAIGGVEIIVIRPGERPVVAAVPSGDNRFLWGPGDAFYHGTGWLGCRPPVRRSR